MKNLLLLFIIFGFGLSATGQKQLRAYLNEHQFYAPGEGNYLEVQLNFVGHTLTYKDVAGKMKGELEITHLFLQGEKVVFFDKYVLSTPEVIDSLVEDFYDIHRYALEPGEYTYELIIQDNFSDNAPISVEKPISITDLSNQISFSSITGAESINYADEVYPTLFTKMGYDIVPLISNYFPTELNFLPYYVEVYGTDIYSDDSIFLVEQKISSNEMTLDMEMYTRYYRYHPGAIKGIAKVVDISLLPTGNYTLELSVLSRNKEVVARQHYNFDRNNSDEVNQVALDNIVLDPAFMESIPDDSTGYYVASLIPISGPSEVRNILDILKERDNEKNIKYIQAFWRQSAKNNAYAEWMKYRAQVHQVERLFGTNYQVGFETDRGRVYLQYGQPSQVTEQPQSNSEYPYEIWQYDKIGRFSNKRFIFYNTTNINNDFKLLHSDLVGELQNFRWQYALNKRNTSDGDIDSQTGGGFQEHYGRNSSLYYNSY